jgi:hypothetical protein
MPVDQDNKNNNSVLIAGTERRNECGNCEISCKFE